MPFAIAIVVSMLITLVSIFFEPKAETNVIAIEAAATCDCDACQWADYYVDAYAEYCDEFTALFNSYTYKVSKNGRSMVNGKFVAMAKGK